MYKSPPSLLRKRDNKHEITHTHPPLILYCVRVSFIGHQGPYRSVARSCCRCSDTLAKSLLLFHFVASCTLHLASAISAPFVHNSLISLFYAKYPLKRCPLACLTFGHHRRWSESIHRHLSFGRAAVSACLLRSW